MADAFADLGYVPNSSTAQASLRQQADAWRLPRSHYEDSAGFWCREGWRPPSVGERERMAGFPSGHTASALTKAEKQGGGRRPLGAAPWIKTGGGGAS